MMLMVSKFCYPLILDDFFSAIFINDCLIYFNGCCEDYDRKH